MSSKFSCFARKINDNPLGNKYFVFRNDGSELEVDLQFGFERVLNKKNPTLTPYEIAVLTQIKKENFKTEWLT